MHKVRFLNKFTNIVYEAIMIGHKNEVSMDRHMHMILIFWVKKMRTNDEIIRYNGKIRGFGVPIPQVRNETTTSSSINDKSLPLLIIS